jgi:hypothetical protein
VKPVVDALPRWRRPVLVVLALVTALLVGQIPKLRAVFAPEELVPPRPAEAARIDAVLGGFRGREEPLLVLLQAPDVLAPEPLRYAHRLARTFEARDWVARVESLTTTPLPRPAAPAADEGLTLDTLEDDLEDGPPREPGPGPALEEALGRVVASDPARFPMGLASLGEGAPVEIAPLVDGPTVDEADRQRVLEAVEGSALVRGRLVDADRTLYAIALVPRADLDEDAAERAVEAVDAWVAEHPPPEGVAARVGGLPAVQAEMVQTLREDQALLVSLAVVGSLLVLLLGFRSWAGVLLPLGAAGMTSGIVVGTMALVGEPLNLLNNVVPPLLITIGLGDAVHLLVRYREELRRDPDRIAASRRTMRAMMGACLLTSVTTAVGFASLMVNDTALMRRFGLTAALGVMLAYLITVIFLPAALPDFRVRPSGPRTGGGLDRAIRRLTRLATRRPRLVVGLSALAFLGAVAVGGGVRLDGALVDQLEPGSRVRETVRILEDELDGVRTLEVGFEGPEGRYASGAGLREVARFEAWLRTQPEVLRVGGPGELVGALWQQLAPGAERAEAWRDPERAAALAALADAAAPETWARRVSEDASRARVVVRVRDEGQRPIGRLIDRIEAQLAGADAVVGGEAYRTARGLVRLVEDLTASLALAVLVIFVMLGLLLRSVRLGLISVLPNVLPLGLTLAYMALRGIPLQASTAIVFSVSIGLVVDGTIHILARYREEIGHGRARRAALRASMAGSGRAVVIGALTLLLGFIALLFASFVPIRLFAELSIVAIATALVAELLVLPALLALFGPEPAAAPGAAPRG